MNRAVLSSARHDWQTPPEVLANVRKVGPIGLDPATSPSNPTGAVAGYTEDDDGLRQPWFVYPHEIAYLNPPFGREISKWMAAVAKAAALGTTTVSLTPARPDSRWWQAAVNESLEGVFLRGRIHFIDAATGLPAETLCKKTGKMKPSKAPFPVNLMLHGPWGTEFVERFRDTFRPHGILFSEMTKQAPF